MSADWWQNFANNFAADLAPLISLFGESPTKQYLSETLTFLDVFIFSMAPIGVITTLVSAIRVAGGPSLRAFIGRAQEGAGVAEAELCSSTSRNVCELYNNGGITRVFGRPKILEFVHDWKPDTHPDQQEQRSHNAAGIYSFRDYLSLGDWEEKGTNLENILDKEKGAKPFCDRKDFAPHPNLSLNIGIRKLPRTLFLLAAILGFILQTGILAFAALVTYKYPNEFRRDDTQIVVPAFQFVCVGTVLLCFGVGMCASIIERSTYERTFERKEKRSSRLYWVQPGNQVVGDQVFDCFAYSDFVKQITKYTSSKRVAELDDEMKKVPPKKSILVWIATVTTIVGFVLQFLGLRTVHSTVSVAQLGAMLVMSMVRALLRTRHLKEEHNLLGDSSTLYLHHELDWLAIEMALEDQDNSARRLLDRSQKPFWCVTRRNKFPSLSAPPQQGIYENSKKDAAKAYLKRFNLAQLTGAQTLASNPIVDNPWEEAMVSSRTWASKLACAIEGVMGVVNRRCTVKGALRQRQVPWSLGCWIGTAANDLNRDSSNSTIQLTISHDTEGTGLQGPWKADRAELESVLGLWLWSIISMQRIRQIDERDTPGSNNSVQRASHLIYIRQDSDSSDSEASLRLWLGNHSTILQKAEFVLYNRFDPGNLWDMDTFGHCTHVREVDIREKHYTTALRIFGSNVIPTSVLDDTKGKLLTILHLPSASSLEMMCAQELFTIFLNTVAPEIEEIRGNTEIVEGPDRFYLTNSTLSEMIQNFTSSGIGNHDDAIACIVPVLHSARKLNSASAFMAARAVGEDYYLKKDWRKAENVLLPALKLALQDFEFPPIVHLPGDTERTSEVFLCLLSLCELYRWALLADKRARLFGLHGLISLLHLFYGQRHLRISDATMNPRDIPRDLLVYRNVALTLCEMENGNNDINRAIQQLEDLPGEQKVWIPHILQDFHDALHQANLEGALCELQPSTPSSCIGRPVLAVAAQHGLYPVLKSLKGLGIDTREVDHNGLNYLHHAAQSCRASIFKDLVGDDRDLLYHKDNFGRTPLHLAAAAGRTNIVMLLIRHFSVKANIRDQSFKSPLDNAILSDHVETFKLLCQLEKEKNAKSPFNEHWDLETARLFQAACCGSYTVFLRVLATIIESNSIRQLNSIRDRLLDCKKDLDLDKSLSSQVFIKVLELLDERGYHADTWETNGRTGLSFAAEADNSDLAIYLLSKYSDYSVELADASGKNCLHYATISRSQSVAGILITSRQFARLLSTDNDGMDPLWYAFKDRPSTIDVMYLRTDPHWQHSILPGTSIATENHFLYCQNRDSRIRVTLYNKRFSELAVDGVLSSSARLFTPLVVVGDSKQIYSAACITRKDNGKRVHCKSADSELEKAQALLHATTKAKILSSTKVGADFYPRDSQLTKVDERDCISVCAIVSDRNIIPFPGIKAAARGSDIAALPQKDKIFVYIQNEYFEIEEVSFGPFNIALGATSEAIVGATTLIHGQGIELRTPIVCFVARVSCTGLLCRGKDGFIRIYRFDRGNFQWSIRIQGAELSRFAITQNEVLFFQKNDGHIYRVEVGREGLISMAVESKQTPEIKVLCDEDSLPLKHYLEPLIEGVD